MVSLSDYKGREQSYVKHIFLERYLEALVHKTASKYAHVVYVDGFAGPWQSANEGFQDTSFGIALNALRRKDIPPDAFTFFLIDPKGWRIPLRKLEPMLARRHSEVIFNFMFDFINRAASMKDPAVVGGLDELMPYGEFRRQLAQLEGLHPGGLASEKRKAVLVDTFSKNLSRLGNYKYVAETTILRPSKNRPLYCLFYATRHTKGIEVFRDCQLKALTEQSKTRATIKVRSAEDSTGQAELFQSLHDMGPDELTSFLATEQLAAEKTLVELSPARPGAIVYEQLWPQVLARHVVRLPDVNRITARLRDEGTLLFPDWERGKRVPQPGYRVQRPSASTP
jgi:hypothetical protein